MRILFFLSNSFILMFTMVLQIWGICCIFIYKEILKIPDKILLIMPLIVPVKTLRRDVEVIKNKKGFVIYLKTVCMYKILFLLNLIICFLFFII